MKIGDIVRLAKSRSKKTARIVLFFTDIKGGVRLDDRLDGFCCWNVADLVKAPQLKKTTTRMSHG